MNLVPATSLDEEDKLFLNQADALFPCNLPFAVISGSHDEINTVRNAYAATAAINPRYDRISHYTGKLREIVKAAVHEFVLKQAAQPMTMWDRIYATRGLNRQVKFTKLYAQYFGA